MQIRVQIGAAAAVVVVVVVGVLMREAAAATGEKASSSRQPAPQPQPSTSKGKEKNLSYRVNLAINFAGKTEYCRDMMVSNLDELEMVVKGCMRILQLGQREMTWERNVRLQKSREEKNTDFYSDAKMHSLLKGEDGCTFHVTATERVNVWVSGIKYRVPITYKTTAHTIMHDAIGEYMQNKYIDTKKFDIVLGQEGLFLYKENKEKEQVSRLRFNDNAYEQYDRQVRDNRTPFAFLVNIQLVAPVDTVIQLHYKNQAVVPCTMRILFHHTLKDIFLECLKVPLNLAEDPWDLYVLQKMTPAGQQQIVEKISREFETSEAKPYVLLEHYNLRLRQRSIPPNTLPVYEPAPSYNETFAAASSSGANASSGSDERRSSSKRLKEKFSSLFKGKGKDKAPEGGH